MLFQLPCKLVVQFGMHQITMHILLEQFGPNEMFALDVLNLVIADKSELIVYEFLLILLQFFSHIADEGHPFGGDSHFWREVTFYFWAF